MCDQALFLIFGWGLGTRLVKSVDTRLPHCSTFTLGTTLEFMIHHLCVNHLQNSVWLFFTAEASFLQFLDGQNTYTFIVARPYVKYFLSCDVFQGYSLSSWWPLSHVDSANFNLAPTLFNLRHYNKPLATVEDIVVQCMRGWSPRWFVAEA